MNEDNHVRRSGETPPSGLPGPGVPPIALARWCAGNGWPVHPLAPGTKTPPANCRDCKDQHHNPRTCPCPRAGRPCHGFHAGTMDRKHIDSWWTASPNSGVGVACGPANLVVIDIDAHSTAIPARSRLLPGIEIHDSVDLHGLASGFDTMALLAAYRQQADPAQDATTLRVRTPSGGVHVWYRLPTPEVRYRSSAGSSPKVALAWQVDVRAEGGYIVAPTTRTRQGTYEPLGTARLPAPLPAWLAHELARTGHVVAPQQAPAAAAVPRARGPLRPVAAHRILDPLLDEVARCGTVTEGAAFTEKLNRAAFTAGGLTAAGHLKESDIRELLTATAHAARPQQTSHNEKIIHDGLAAGAARPLHLKGRS
ncbi:bifunctional DNA primase/polymerase [Streptomyces sp. NPDC050273]|uniref:bifunctional DNA primase/polymerase n=1 Tax=Streptomyces sp. NPDC050273 TaxID=3154933 RepID=UPI00342AC402